MGELSLLDNSLCKYLSLLLVDEIVNDFDPSLPEVVPLAYFLQVLVPFLLQKQLFAFLDLLSVFKNDSPTVRQKASRLDHFHTLIRLGGGSPILNHLEV